MANFPSFLEYLNDKGAVVEKPEVETVPDYHGPDDKTPPNSKVPYKTSVSNKAPEKGEKGFAQLGDERLKYEPQTKIDYEVKKDVMKEYVDENGKVQAKAREDIKCDYKGSVPKSPEGKGAKPYVAADTKKVDSKKGLAELGDEDFVYEPDTQKPGKVTKTENFINKTKGMSISEFTKYMLKECGCGQVQDIAGSDSDTLPFITAYTTGKFQPHPPEVIRYISTLADKNNGILENLVSTMISMGGLNKLLKAVFEHPEAYEELVSLFSDENGEARSSSFVNSMSNSYSKFLSDQDSLYESVGGPFGFEDEEEEEDEDSDKNGDEFEDDEDSEDESDEDSEEGDEFGDEEDSDEEDDEEELMSLDDEPESEEAPKHHEKKLKKKFAHDHLIGAMKNHEQMLKAMRG